MAKIPPLSLYIINRAKFRKLVRGLSSKALSRVLNHKESYITTIENPARDTQYPPHEYPGLAAALDWTVKDLLPPDDWDVGDGTKIEKKVLSLSNPEDMQLVVDGLIDYGFFNEPKSLTDAAKHLYIDGKEEETVLNEVLGELVKNGFLALHKTGYQKVI